MAFSLWDRVLAERRQIPGSFVNNIMSFCHHLHEQEYKPLLNVNSVVVNSWFWLNGHELNMTPWLI